MRIIPSVFGYKIDYIYKAICPLLKFGVDTIHVDVFDGTISPMRFDGFDYIRQLKKINLESEVKFNVHLITNKPCAYLDTLISMGIEEVSADLKSYSSEIQYFFTSSLKKNNIKVGLIYNEIWFSHMPNFEDVDYLHVCGTCFETNRVLTESEIIDNIELLQRFGMPIMVDGGVGVHNIGRYRDAGASIFISGKGIFEGDAMTNYQQMYKILV